MHNATQVADSANSNGDQLFAEFLRATLAMRAIPADSLGTGAWRSAVERQHKAFSSWTLYLQTQATSNEGLRKLRAGARLAV